MPVPTIASGRRFARTGLVLLALAGTFAATAARAATVTLSDVGALAASFRFLSPYGATPVAVGDDYQLGVPGQYTFSNQFSSSQAGLDPLAISPVGPYTFMDSYRFTIGEAVAGSTLVASLGLGDTFNIDSLQLRLYRTPTATTDPTLPGIPAGSTLLTGWQGSSGGGTTITSLFDAVQSGTYILDVAGIANGLQGGSYVGQLNLSSPVPLPGGALLLLSGLGAVGTFVRRRAA
jgi:hypothetical protein